MNNELADESFDRTASHMAGEYVSCNTKKGAREMIEAIVKPQQLDNDVGVMKILQLMGQLTLSDIQYVLKVTLHIYGKTHEK